MNNNKTKNPSAGRNLFLLSALSVLFFSSCSNDTDAVTEEITLTTPVIELGGVEASASRGAGAWNDMVSYASLRLYMQDAQGAQVGDKAYYEYSSNSSAWRVMSGYAPVTVKGGPGSYRAGIKAYINLNENESTGMPAIEAAWYGYRGAIEVQADGRFAPMGALQPFTSAVQWKLNDANGNLITQSGKYLISPVGLAHAYDFVDGDDGQSFPQGTAAPVPQAQDYPGVSYLEGVYGNYTPGTYPATWPDHKLVTSTELTEPWVLAEVVYCEEGFEYDYSVNDYLPKGTTTTWTVNYPEQQLTLAAGKLYTFTITLGKDAQITLNAQNAVSVGDWVTDSDSEINVGK